MKQRRQTAAGSGLAPLGGLVLLPLLAIAGTLLIGSQALVTQECPSVYAVSGGAAFPGMGATILPRWTLGNFDPRLEGAARGDEWPVPAGISYCPDRTTTLTSFPRRNPGEPLPVLFLVKPGESR